MTTDQIVADIIRREGGFSNKPSDKGGPTKFGITSVTLGEWRKLGRRATVAEVKTLTEEEASAIYRKRYVAPFEAVPDPLRALVADWGVTSGTVIPAKAMQTSLASQGAYTGSIDGIVGPKTRSALVASRNLREVYRYVLGARLAFYSGLALGDSSVVAFLETHPESQLHNLAGWQNRTMEFLL